ncbi:MAG: bifunctional phosphoglucose/phosphomannose isomerase [Bacteroidetes bacterium]|nr:bifunctional phosphoglucose/phosphomannose isomerase [Bacteroidota bacterium]
MKTLVQDFTKQLKEAKTIADKAIIFPAKNVANIVITGLGGSGIGGTLVSELFADNCSVPVTVNKNYCLPAFVSETTLLIVCSYSGNTEETVNAIQQGISKKAQIVCISSGGKILELAKQYQFNFIQFPGGKSPRAFIGYSLVQLIKVFVANGFANENIFSDLEKSIELLDKENTNIKTEAQAVAQKLLHKIPVIYSLGAEGVAVRFRQQINENSKMLCWHHTFPEMNHNELVGWTVKHDNLAVVTFHTAFDYERTKKRYEICIPIFEKYSSGVIDIYAKGQSKLEQFFYLINMGDWISCYLADLKGIDPIEVNVIDYLKTELSKF